LLFGLLIGLFRGRERAEWGRRLEALDVPYAPMYATDEVPEDPQAKQQAAIKSLYQMAGGACALVLETIADSCEIASVTSDTRVSDREARGPQLTMTSRVVMKVKFKPAAKATP